MKTQSEAFLSCSRCGSTYSIEQVIWRCGCGGILDVQRDASFRLDSVNAKLTTIWRYQDAIALHPQAKPVSMGEGFTPLIEVLIDSRRIWVKQDQLAPTGSYKDRGAAVLISQAQALGVKRVVEDSSGNAGAAVAAYCARAGIACEIYVPENTSPGKLAQIERYGAVLRKIPGSREDTAAAVMAAAEKNYYASHSWNPFFFEGTKTFAYEVCEQMGWQAPDTVILPAGNGTLLLGAAIGFDELLKAKVISQMPKIIAVQAAACAPLAAAFEKEMTTIPEIVKVDTLAEGIAIANPIRGRQIIGWVRKSDGWFISVTENEITQSLLEMCQAGFYIEPTSAATIAGVKKYLNHSEHGETVVTVFTGHGLKATEKMLHL